MASICEDAVVFVLFCTHFLSNYVSFGALVIVIQKYKYLFIILPLLELALCYLLVILFFKSLNILFSNHFYDLGCVFENILNEILIFIKDFKDLREL